MSVKVIQNTHRYIQSDTLRECFVYGKHSYIDKVLCGNGFSTAFLQEVPPTGKINIIIAPNRSVITGKEFEYKQGRLNTKNRIGFIYEGSENRITDDYDVLMFVADSFYYGVDTIREIFNDRINWILIDEFHTMEIDASYRRVLKFFTLTISEFISPTVAISFVSASPNLYSPVDIRIDNAHISPVIVHYTNSRESTIQRIRDDIKNGQRVFLATNSASFVYRLRDDDGIVEAHYKVGNSFMETLVSMVTVKHNHDSKLIIATSSAFEGFDIYGNDWKVYFIEDRGAVNECFYISRFYQAISRTRDGALYVEYCQRRLTGVREGVLNEKKLDKFIQSTGIFKGLSVEKKQKKEYSEFHDFVIFKPKDDTFILSKNTTSIKLWYEKKLYDTGFDAFNQFLSDRNITIIHLNEVQEPLKRARIGYDMRKNNLTANKDIIINRKLFVNTRFLKSYDSRLSTDKIEALEKRLRLHVLKKTFTDPNCIQREMTDREKIGLEIFSNAKYIQDIIDEVSKVYKKTVREKYSWREAEKKISSFKKSAQNYIMELITILMESHISVVHHIVAHRDYNVLVKLNVPSIKIVCDIFGVDFDEVDIKSAFPRIIHAKYGYPLPDDFYGKNKENKRAISIAINTFIYDDKQPTEKKYQKRNSKKRLIGLGFNEVIVDKLIEEYFDAEHKGVIMNSLSYHEKNIIAILSKELKEQDNDGVVRRHDSVLIFNNRSGVRYLRDVAVSKDGYRDIVKIPLSSFEYLNQTGWFLD